MVTKDKPNTEDVQFNTIQPNVSQVVILNTSGESIPHMPLPEIFGIMVHNQTKHQC